VLAAHWERNRSPIAPQFSATSTATSSTDSLSVKSRHKRNTIRVPTESNAKPKHLRFYANNARWKELIEDAKRLYHIFIATVNAFDDGYKEAFDCLREAEQTFVNKGIPLEEGMCLPYEIWY
jgi:hypothetical protein